jgi:transposase
VTLRRLRGSTAADDEVRGTKTADQLDLQALHRDRERLVSQRTGIINQIRAFLLDTTAGRPPLLLAQPGAAPTLFSITLRLSPYACFFS